MPGATVTVVGLPDGRLPAAWDDVKQTLEDTRAATTADLVLAPRLDDAHQDHRLVGELVHTVWRDAVVLHYELPKWDGDLSAPSVFVGLSSSWPGARWRCWAIPFPARRAGTGGTTTCS